eukprot:c22016_g3_i2 orf=306-659(+)
MMGLSPESMACTEQGLRYPILNLHSGLTVACSCQSVSSPPANSAKICAAQNATEPSKPESNRVRTAANSELHDNEEDDENEESDNEDVGDDDANGEDEGEGKEDAEHDDIEEEEEEE